MGACATKPGDLKVKGEAPVVVDDGAAPLQAAADEKAKAGGVLPVAAAAVEVDQTDVSRRRSLSDLLKRDAEVSDGEADHQEAEKVVVVVADEEPASAAAAKGETMESSPQATVQAPVAIATEHDEPKDDDLPSGDGDAHAVEQEKQVDPESVQVAAVTAAAAAAPSSEESKVADDDDASA